MANILIIYTGGTIGMAQDPESGQLKPFDFGNLFIHLPELKRFNHKIDFHVNAELIDSSNTNPAMMANLADLVHSKMDAYDGFVILHGTDTMAYTASMLSFMIQGLRKPIILTGSQLPIGELRTDAKENLLTALELAAANENGVPILQEVSIYFDYKLLRGNRSTKVEASHFGAFDSPNLAPLAIVGIDIEWNKNLLLRSIKAAIEVKTGYSDEVALFKVFPGISETVLKAYLSIPGIKAIVMETYGAGNAPTYPWFIDLLKTAVQNGLTIVNITQCQGGKVKQGVYETSGQFEEIGIISGQDMTSETAIMKLQWLLGQGIDSEQVKSQFKASLVGEV